MINENKEKTIETLNTDIKNDFLRENLFLSLYFVFAVLSSFLLGFLICKYWQIEFCKTAVYYSEVK